VASIKIYGVPPSTFTRAVRLACHEKGIDYELIPTFPGTVEPINPFRKIPAMSHGDLTIYESSAIRGLRRSSTSGSARSATRS
jgi:glutathione S-transferase